MERGCVRSTSRSNRKQPTAAAGPLDTAALRPDTLLFKLFMRNPAANPLKSL